MKTAMRLVCLTNASDCAVAAFGSATTADLGRPEGRGQVSAAAPDIRTARRNFLEPSPAVTARAHDSKGEQT